WFSSWLWPLSVFDGFENQEELKYYYPTNTLVTGWDIMFFWVARMIMAGYEYAPELLGADFVKENGAFPFKDVYFTGMVRDKKRRKMSKSLGNSPEALELINNYGADGVRFGMLSSSSAGNDIVFDAPFDPETNEVLNESKLCEQGRNFCNKMWNALRLIKGWTVIEQPERPETAAMNDLAYQWMDQKLQQTLRQMEEQFESYRLSEALIGLYSFIWNDFFSWYLEVIKTGDDKIDQLTLDRTISLFERLMTVLHPFMPFITEEIWHGLKARKDGEDCVVSSYPKAGNFDQSFIAMADQGRDIVTKVRDLRSSHGIAAREPLRLFMEKSAQTEALFNTPGWVDTVKKMGVLAELALTEQEPESTVSFLSDTSNLFLELNIEVDVEAERDKLSKELSYYEGFVKSVQKKRSNERFVQSAPAAVVEKERKKLEDGEAKMAILKENLAKLQA
ncbi:MAG: class I tRNA ligase family protein, partial [Phaeodactylibacter sp.]|nr:class I tRNA ligase family protein [Phaeodactylibacter sp.]